MSLVKAIAITEAPGDYDDIIDVRSPAEFAQDHIPGAISAPVLDDDQRASIGTLYAQVSVFEAQRQGAALVARNIARHLETTFADRPRHWRPLVYCWRGGMRSGAMAHVMAQVGWRTGQLTGGYKAYRRHVIDSIASLPATLDFRVVCGATGSGKSRLLQALAERGAQVLDLEKLACHRGSLLGSLPDEAQPAQKMFETRLWDALRNYRPGTRVYVEAESRKVGVLTVPDALLQRMRASPCLAIDAPIVARVEFLLEDYAHFLRNPELLQQRLRLLTELHGHPVIDGWCELVQQGRWPELVSILLQNHYDPAYRRSSHDCYPQLKTAPVLHTPQLDPGSVGRLANQLLQEEHHS